MTTLLDNQIAADEFLARMKEEIATVKRRMERYGYNFKRNVAKTYVERADWHTKFIVAAEDRRERLNEKLTVEELVEEHEDQLGEVLAFIHALTPEQLPRTAQQFKDGLDRVMAARERNRERAKQMLAKQGVRCE